MPIRGVCSIEFGVVVVALIFCEHLLLGANRTDLALGFTILHALLLIWLLSTRWGIEYFTAILSRLLIPAVLFCLCIAVLLLAMTLWRDREGPYNRLLDPQAHLVGLMKLGGLASLFLIGAVLGADRSRSRRIFKTISVFGLFFGLFSLVFHFFTPALEGDFAAGRLTAAFVSPNTAATLFGILALLVLTELSQRWRVRQWQSVSVSQAADSLLHEAPVEIAAFITATACLVLTGSRMALGVFLAGLVLLFLLERGSGNRSAPRYLVLVILGALAVAGGQLLLRRLMSVGNDLPWHTTLLVAHWHAFLDTPLWGYGLGSFPLVNAMVMTPATMPQLALMGAVHNVFLQWLEQAGLLGSIPMLLCVAWIIGVIARRGPRGVTTVSLFLLLHGLTDYALEVPSIAAMWALLLGLGYGAAGAKGLSSALPPRAKVQTGRPGAHSLD